MTANSTENYIQSKPKNITFFYVILLPPTTYSYYHAMVFLDSSATAKEWDQENDNSNGDENYRRYFITRIYEIWVAGVNVDVGDYSNNQYSQAWYLKNWKSTLAK